MAVYLKVYAGHTLHRDILNEEKVIKSCVWDKETNLLICTICVGWVFDLPVRTWRIW